MIDLMKALQDLGMRGAAEGLDDLVSLATKKRWGPRRTLEELVKLESEDRSRRSLESRLKRGKLGRFKPMEDYDWSWPESIDQDLVERTLTLDFLEDARNVVIVSPHGLGKTMIAKGIAHRAILSGHSVLFTTASQLLLDLSSRESARALDLRLRHYANTGLLVIDELGYLSYDSRGADLLFQVVSRRYEKKSLVLTTNLAFRDWPTIFPNATCATALIDRVVHHADIISIKGESYRRREAEQDVKKRRGRARKTPKKR